MSRVSGLVAQLLVVTLLLSHNPLRPPWLTYNIDFVVGEA